MKDIMELCDTVRETGFTIHRYHKHGHIRKYTLSQVGGERGNGKLASGLLSFFSLFASFHGCERVQAGNIQLRDQSDHVMDRGPV
jgi:hypothetical protein